MREQKNYFLVMMGGSGTRFGASVPKQFVEVGGRHVFLYLLDAIESLSVADGFVVVSHKDWVDYIKEVTKGKYSKMLAVVEGGDCRSKSVYNGLKELKKYAKDEDNVLIHDATHPHLDGAKIPELIKQIDLYSAATLVSSVYDTCYIKKEDGLIDHVVDRKTVAVGASPEGFKMGVIYPIYDNASEEELEKMTSAGAIWLSSGGEMGTVVSELLNLKITYPNDMELYKLLYNNYYDKR